MTAVGVLFIGGVTLFRLQPSAVPSPTQYIQLTNIDSATQPALSPDGRMMAFVRGTSTFTGDGQIYVKLLPDGEPVQLTHDKLLKMAPRFSPDGSRIAYSTIDLSTGWDVWTVSVIGGQQPRRLLSNAEGLTWIRESGRNGGTQSRVLFSEATGKGITMAVVSSTESRSDRRTVFVRLGRPEAFSRNRSSHHAASARRRGTSESHRETRATRRARPAPFRCGRRRSPHRRPDCTR
jgi:eukaryotic-like serine/threonine-protein kinase